MSSNSCQMLDTKYYIEKFFEYTISDTDYLLKSAMDRIPESRNAGPIFMVMMNGISAMSGIMYGFDIDEGERFAKFLTEEMGLSKAIAGFLYYGCRIPLANIGMMITKTLYSHSNITWDQIFEGESFLAVAHDLILIHVGKMGEAYLKVFRKLQADFEADSEKWGVSNFNVYWKDADQYLDQAYSDIKERIANATTAEQ